jgi:predicted GIY-YIG superfamily endonuclease
MRISVNSKPAMTVYRRALKRKKIVYILAARKSLKYKDGRSRILYIGMTKKGIRRIAESVAQRSKTILKQRGVRELDVHVVTCEGRSGLQSWGLLERALVAHFRSRYFEVPLCNTQLKNKRVTEQLEQLFKPRALGKILEIFESPAKLARS